MITKLDEISLFSVAFTMTGNSMDNNTNRCFADGDILRCDEADIADVQVNRSYVIRIDDSLIVRLVTKITDDEITATPFNPLYKEYVFNKNQIRQIFLIKSTQRKIVEWTCKPLW